MSPKQSLARELKSMVAQGRTEGRAEGRVEGQRSILAKQLRLKFGALPENVQGRLAEAGVSQLEAWAGRVLTAATLAEVWEEG